MGPELQPDDQTNSSSNPNQPVEQPESVIQPQIISAEQHSESLQSQPAQPVNNGGVSGVIVGGAPISTTPTFAVDNERKKHKKIAIGFGAALILTLIVGLFFVFYVQNRPNAVWSTGLKRSGKALAALSDKTTDKKLRDGFSKTQTNGSLTFTTPEGSYSGTLNSKMDEENADVIVTFKSEKDKEKAKEITGHLLATLPKDSDFPNLYLQINGIETLGEAFAPDAGKINGKWFELNSKDFTGTLDSNDSKTEQPTAEELSDLAKRISDVTSKDALTADETKSILVLKSFEKKETQDGIKTYHYKATLSKDHTKNYCKDLAEAVIDSTAYKKLSGSNTEGIKDQKDSIDDSCDEITSSIDENNEFDVWIDAKYKLIYKIREYFDDNDEWYAEVGQHYKGGSSVELFTNIVSDKEKVTVTASMGADFKNYTTNFKITGRGILDDEKYGLDLKAESKPLTESIKVEKPANTQSFQEVFGENPEDLTNLLFFGLGSLTPVGQGVQLKAQDSERQTDINALHGQLEAYYAQNGFYPSFKDLNSAAFITTNLKGLDPSALQDPTGTSPQLVNKPTKNAYSYQVTPAGCTSESCTGYTLTATLQDGTTYVKKSLN